MHALDQRWRKSTRSGNAGQCVEVRAIDGGVELRDSKNPTGPVLRFNPGEWDAFTGGVRKAEFEL